MNILFYCSEYPPFHSGGIGTYVKIVAEELAKKKHEVYVVGYYRRNKVNSHEIVNGVHIYRFGFGFYLHKFIEKVGNKLLYHNLPNPIVQFEVSYIGRKIRKIIDKHSIDIVEFPDFIESSLNSAHLVFKKIKCKSIIRLHGSATWITRNYDNSHHYQDIVKSNDLNHLGMFDYVSGVSLCSLDFIKQTFPSLRFEKEVCITNPIEDSFIKSNKPSFTSDVLFIGKLTKDKGCYALINAFNLIADRYPYLRLKMLGGGDIEAARRQVDTRFLDRVVFLGFCDRETVKAEIDKCAFACNPSYFETFGIASLEVMARRRTVIGSMKTSSGYELINDREDGFLIDPDEPEQIADRISFLLDNPDIRNAMADKAFEKVCSKFSLSSTIVQLEAFYNEILNS